MERETRDCYVLRKRCVWEDRNKIQNNNTTNGLGVHFHFNNAVICN